MAEAPCLRRLDEIIENFDLLDEWDDRYRYLIELGRMLDHSENMRATTTTSFKAAPARFGSHQLNRMAPKPRLHLQGDSDAHIVRGLVACCSHSIPVKPRRKSSATDAVEIFPEKLGLREHLTPQRSNGFRSMVDRIRRDATAALAAAT